MRIEIRYEFSDARLFFKPEVIHDRPIVRLPSLLNLPGSVESKVEVLTAFTERKAPIGRNAHVKATDMNASSVNV